MNPMLMQDVEATELLAVEGGLSWADVGNGIRWALGKLLGGGGDTGTGGGAGGGGPHAVVDCRGGCNGATIIIR